MSLKNQLFPNEITHFDLVSPAISREMLLVLFYNDLEAIKKTSPK
jgi:hypothetical protein